MPPPPTPQYLFLLMTERGGTIIFCRILAPPQCPPQSSDATILISLINDRQGALLSFLGFLRPPMPPSPDTTIINNLNDRGGGHYLCRISAPPMPPPPSHDATILNYLNDRERGLYCFL